MSSIEQRALDFATAAHTGQKRKTGENFITHPIAVADGAVARLKMYVTQVDVSTLRAIALLHDTLEDTETSVDTLKSQFGGEIAEAVRNLTHLPAQSYYDYIVGLTHIFDSTDFLALLVKLADLDHNISTWHEKGSLIDKWRLARYILSDTLRSNLYFFEELA